MAEWEELREQHWNICITICKQIACGKLLYSTGLCDDREGWDGAQVGGSFKTEGVYVYLWLIYVVVWQKPTQHCKAITLQLKLKKNSSWSLGLKARYDNWFPKDAFPELYIIESQSLTYMGTQIL